MSDATLEVGGDAPGLQLSVSQIQKFTTCENRWLLNRQLPEEQKQIAKSEPLSLGTLMHSCLAAWRSGRSWREAWIAAVIEEVGSTEVAYKVSRGKIVELAKGWQAPKWMHRALPIMDDWEKVHGRTGEQDKDPAMAGMQFVATELPFNIEVPGVPGARIRGFLDSMVAQPVDHIRVHDRMKVVEDKTMGRWGRENQVPFDLQLNVYLWAARQMNGNVDGAVFEAISTYDYKNGTPEIRFKRLFLPYDQRLVDRTMHDVAAAARRMAEVLEDPERAVRNVGDACTYCDFRRVCLTPWEVA